MPHDYFALVVAIVGASIMPWMLFYQQSASVDKKLTREDLKGSRVETLVGAFASQALMAAIVIAAAAAMESAPAASASASLSALPEGLARLATGGTGWLIAIGLMGSGLLALVVVSLSAAWGIGELMGWPHSLNLKPSQARQLLRRLLRRGSPGRGRGAALRRPGPAVHRGRWSSTWSSWRCRWPSWFD